MCKQKCPTTNYPYPTRQSQFRECGVGWGAIFGLSSAAVSPPQPPDVCGGDIGFHSGVKGKGTTEMLAEWETSKVGTGKEFKEDGRGSPTMRASRIGLDRFFYLDFFYVVKVDLVMQGGKVTVKDKRDSE